MKSRKNKNRVFFKSRIAFFLVVVKFDFFILFFALASLNLLYFNIISDIKQTVQVVQLKKIFFWNYSE